MHEATSEGYSEEYAAHKAAHHEPWHSMQGRLIREVIFGANDGLITAFGFIAGVSGAHVAPILIFLTGIAEAVAGAMSMMFGAYLSTKAQQQYFENEINKEREEIDANPQRETEEIREIYRAQGFSEEEIEILAKRITGDKKRWLFFMIREELGLVPEHFDNPWTAGIVIGVSFLLGGLLPIIPYMFIHSSARAMPISILITLISLFTVGCGKTKFTKTSWLHGGIEMLAVGAIAGAIGFGIGHLISILGLNPS